MVSQYTWPFDHGRCCVTPEVVTFRRGWSTWEHTRSDPRLRVTRYDMSPFVWRTVFWIEHSDRRRGFVVFRSWALLRSLQAHGWPVDLWPRRRGRRPIPRVPSADDQASVFGLSGNCIASGR